MSSSSNYARLGRIGIATPQANPTVEPEIALLLPRGVGVHCTRLVSRGEPKQRLDDYFWNLDKTLQSYDTLKLDAFGFGCTGSSYFIDERRADAFVQELEQRFATPVVTATAAIAEALQHLGARSIALACPYPDWLLEAACAYWMRAGYQIVDQFSLQSDAADTRSIYALDADAATERLANHWAGVQADAFFITGTGLPTLPSIARLQPHSDAPIISSNLCLAWECLRRANISAGEHAPGGDFVLLDNWQDELSAL